LRLEQVISTFGGGGAPMSEALSLGTIRRIAALFPAAQRAEVRNVLVVECGRTLPFAEALGAGGIELSGSRFSELAAVRLIICGRQSSWPKRTGETR
jgi:hypothetical protein